MKRKARHKTKQKLRVLRDRRDRRWVNRVMHRLEALHGLAGALGFGDMAAEIRDLARELERRVA